MLAETLCPGAMAAECCTDAGCWRVVRAGCHALHRCFWWTAGAACRHLASSEGSYKVSEWLLCEEGADVNALDRFKRTPLEVLLCCYLRSTPVAACRFCSCLRLALCGLALCARASVRTHHQPFCACCTSVPHHNLCLQPARIGTLSNLQQHEQHSVP